jgi:hypothetical protein
MKIQSTSAPDPVSPLDVNIENLFEMPEVVPVKAEQEPAPVSVAATTPVTAAKPAPETKTHEVPENSVIVIDTSSQIKIPAEMIAAEPMPVSKPPVEIKASRADSYHVEIRRPGKRV